MFLAKKKNVGWFVMTKVPPLPYLQTLWAWVLAGEYVKFSLNRAQSRSQKSITQCIRANWCQICHLGSEMVKNCHAKKSLFLGLCKSLLMGLGQDQQQHPSVHSGGVSRVWRCGCWRYWNVTVDLQHVTHDIWYMTPDTFFVYLCYHPHA